LRIIVDADACPVKDIIIKNARKKNIPVLMFASINHVLNDDYAQVIYVDHGRDSADYAIANNVKKGDLVITQDYGLAALVLSKQALAMNQNGIIYNSKNIETLLLQRHINQKIRNSGGRISGPSKRKKKNNVTFEQVLKKHLPTNS